jgi:hypothetical protein
MKPSQNPIDDDCCFDYDLLKIISRLHDVSTGIGGDPCNDDFEEARWIQWKLSVWKIKHMGPDP